MTRRLVHAFGWAFATCAAACGGPVGERSDAEAAPSVAPACECQRDVVDADGEPVRVYAPAGCAAPGTNGVPAAELRACTIAEPTPAPSPTPRPP